MVALFMRDYCNSYTEKVWSCWVWSFFPFLKILKTDPFMIKKQDPVLKLILLWSKNKTPFFLSSGVSAITLLLINLLINVTYFWNRLLDAHLLTYQTIPSSIFHFLSFGPQKSKKKTVENHYIFYNPTKFLSRKSYFHERPNCQLCHNWEGTFLSVGVPRRQKIKNIYIKLTYF